MEGMPLIPDSGAWRALSPGNSLGSPTDESVYYEAYSANVRRPPPVNPIPFIILSRVLQRWGTPPAPSVPAKVSTPPPAKPAVKPEDAEQERLRRAALAEARRRSLIPGIQRDIHRGMGVTGRGVDIGVIEAIARDKSRVARPVYPGATGPVDHANACRAIISGNDFCVAPGANAYYYGYVRNPEAKRDRPIVRFYTRDNVDDFNQYVIDHCAAMSWEMAERLETIALERDRPRILSISQGMSPVRMASFIYHQLQEKEDGRFRFPAIREAVYGRGVDPEKLSRSEAIRRCLNYVNRQLAQDKARKGHFTQMQARYQRAVADLTRRGTLVAVCAGNEKNDWGVLTRPEEETNFLALSPDALVVGATLTTNPSNLLGEKPADFSSRGPVHVVAPGAGVYIEDKAVGGSQIVSGTSFATPFVAAVAALMLEVNPDLTPAQIKEILIESATPTGNMVGGRVGAAIGGTLNPLGGAALLLGGEREARLQVGAGTVNPKRAVELALARRRTR